MATGYIYSTIDKIWIAVVYLVVVVVVLSILSVYFEEKYNF